MRDELPSGLATCRIPACFCYWRLAPFCLTSSVCSSSARTVHIESSSLLKSVDHHRLAESDIAYSSIDCYRLIALFNPWRKSGCCMLRPPGVVSPGTALCMIQTPGRSFDCCTRRHSSCQRVGVSSVRSAVRKAFICTKTSSSNITSFVLLHLIVTGRWVPCCPLNQTWWLSVSWPCTSSLLLASLHAGR